MEPLARTWIVRTAVLTAALSSSACAAKRCEYNSPQPLESLSRFAITVAVPDGSTHSCRAGYTVDGGRSASGWPSPVGGEISGWVTESQATAFSLDTCATANGCNPNVYRFAIDAADLTLALPLGRQVTVTWQLSFFMGCAQGLVVYDGPAPAVDSTASPPIWLAGADANLDPPSIVPFSVSRRALSCNPNAGDRHPCGAGFPAPDDYALVFTPASGKSSLSVAMGKTGTLAVTVAPGVTQHLRIRNLRSFQSDRCDDYWNWGWWALGDSVGA